MSRSPKSISAARAWKAAFTDALAPMLGPRLPGLEVFFIYTTPDGKLHPARLVLASTPDAATILTGSRKRPMQVMSTVEIAALPQKM